MKLSPDKVLKRLPGVELRFDAAPEVLIKVDGRWQRFLSHSVRILEVFAQPQTTRAAMERLRAGGTQDWIDIVGTITRLYEAGVLVDASSSNGAGLTDTGFGSPAVHIAMLNDRQRTETFLDAIAEVVKPGDVVVDIGTGTGVLAVAAARCGASRVFAIEAGPMSLAARSVFESSGFADRITLVRGWSTEIELPVRADVMVSEIIGTDPLEERVLQTTLDARRRLLGPCARFVPSRIKSYCLAVSVPEDRVARRRFSEKEITNWNQWYGFDFSSLIGLAPQSGTHEFSVNSCTAKEWSCFSSPVMVADIDLSTYTNTTVSSEVELLFNRTGIFNGLLMYFELSVGSKTISTNPVVSDAASSWPNAVWLVEPRQVRAGERLSIQYDYNKHQGKSEIQFIS